jgi:tetratricopeptide (TPR) repeat protein
MKNNARVWTFRKLRLLAVTAAFSLIGIVGQSGGSPGADLEPLHQKESSRPHAAAAWALKGWNLVRAADYRAAAEAFAAANRLDGKEPSFLVGLGLSRHRLRQDEAAAAVLERALRLDANVGQAHALLGDIYEQRGDVTAARRHYDAAFRQDPNDVVLQERLAEITRETGFAARLDRLFSAHFIVKYHGSENRALAHQVADRLEQAYQRIGRLLSYVPAEPFTVILYPDRQFQTATLSPSWSHGLFDGRIHLPREALKQSPQAVQRILDHEYVHAAVYRLSGGRAPTWLDEGLARYCEEGLPGDRTRAPSTQDRDSLYSLHGDFMSLPRRPAAVAYEQSLGATTALIQRHGLARVIRLLDTLLVIPDFPRAFEAVFQERYSDFNRRWILSEEKRKG